MKTPLVSIVIPTYNKSLLIETTLLSVLNQTYKNIEMILVDNGSTDDTRLKIKEFTSENEANFKIINLGVNKGPSNARNEGILASSGDYIFFLDGDDVFFQEKIRTQVTFMEENPHVGLSITPYVIYSNETQVLRLIRSTDPTLLIENWLNMSGFGGSVESTGCIRRSEIKPTLFYDTTLMGSEGLDFMLKWSEESIIGILSEPLTIYRLSPNQLHRDLSAIKENMSRLVVKYSKNEKQRVKITNMQNAFFELSKLRSIGTIEIIPSIITLISLNLDILKMAISIFKRNFVAVLLGLRYRKCVRTLISSLG